MGTTNKEKFESLWQDFISLVKGKLLLTGRNQTLTTPLANLILSEAASSWVSEYEINGKWLQQYKDENEAKAALVQDILYKDMKFSDINMKRDLPDYYDYIIPAAGAGVGYGTGMLLGLGKIAQLVSVLGPAILLFPAVKMFRKNQQESNIVVNVDLYIEQLNKFRDSVLSVLS